MRGRWTQRAQVWFCCSHIHHVTLGKLVNFSEALFPHLQNEGNNNNAGLRGLLGRLTETTCIN